MRDDDPAPPSGDALPDLSAWEAPPPPAGLADAVLARLAAADAADANAARLAGAAAPAATAVEPAGAHGRTRVLAALATVGVAAAALALYFSFHVYRALAPAAQGELAAASPSHVDLGDASADLDAGARVRWTRDARGVTVWQRGVVRWSVPAGHTLLVHPGDAPDVAASSADASGGASIEATGGSLRVEVPMTFSDARVIGASALTAAAVALATVVVYEGHVKATSGGQTVMVLPGAIVELHRAAPPGPPVPPTPPTPPEPPLVGAAPIAGDHTVAPNPPVEFDSNRDHPIVHVTRTTRVLANRYPKAELAFLAQPSDDLYADHVNGTWTFVEDDEGDGGWVPTSALTSPSCNPQPFIDRGNAKVGIGDDLGALANFEAALRCHFDPQVNRLAFMEACKAEKPERARAFYKRLSATDQRMLAQICLRSGIDASK